MNYTRQYAIPTDWYSDIRNRCSKIRISCCRIFHRMVQQIANENQIGHSRRRAIRSTIVAMKMKVSTATDQHIHSQRPAAQRDIKAGNEMKKGDGKKDNFQLVIIISKVRNGVVHFTRDIKC